MCLVRFSSRLATIHRAVQIGVLGIALLQDIGRNDCECALADRDKYEEARAIGIN